MGRRVSRYEQGNMCLQFFISGANGIAKHSGEKSFAGVHPSPFYQKVLGGQKDNIQMFFSRIFYII